jgi:hypothetical protein
MVPIEDVMKPKKIPALPTSGKRDSLRTFFYRFHDHILALASGTLGVRPRLPDPNRFRPLLMSSAILHKQKKNFKGKNDFLGSQTFSIIIM